MVIRLKAVETPLGSYIEGTYTESYYTCPTCKGNFDEHDYEQVEVLYNGEVMGDHHGNDSDGDTLLELDDENCTQCSGGMRYIKVGSGTFENAWLCGGNCFNHDLGDKPTTLTREVEDDEGGEYEGSGEVWQCGKCRATFWQAHYDGDADQAKADAVRCCQ